MRDYISIGSTPNDEQCVQVGEENYYERSQLECKTYIKQLERVYGTPPPGSYFKTAGYPHDFGTYYEVEFRYTDDSEAHLEYLFGNDHGKKGCEMGCDTWDEESRKKLGI